MADLTTSSAVDTMLQASDNAGIRSAIGCGTAATATLATLLSDFTYTAATRVLASASTGASVTLTLADGTNPGLMASADFTKLNTITTKRVVGRNTGSTGPGEEVTADQLLDWIGTAASGDILYRGASTHSRLTIGAANTILNSSGTAPQYSSLSTLLDTIGTAANGDMFYRSAANTYSRLAIGASGRILTSSGSAPQYSTIDTVLESVAGTPANGDFIYRSGGAYARLPASGASNGSLLYMNTATPVPVWSTKWTVNSSGTLTGATGSLSGSSTPALAITQTWSNAATTFAGATITITDTNSAAGSLPFQILGGAAGTTNLWKVDKSGNTVVGGTLQVSGASFTVPNSIIYFDLSSVGGVTFHANNTTGTAIGKGGYQPGIVCGTGCQIGFSSDGPNTGVDTAWRRDAAGAMSLRNSTTTQKISVYNTESSSLANYERLALTGTTGSNLSITCESAGTGSANLDLVLTPKGTGKVKFGTHSAIAAETVTGYITIIDSGGNTRKIAVVS